ncbi:NAD-dependent succinate-semialdehyde dehydrogenase [Rhodococcus koreensis]|uniref:NAD-dependent succinate-semialdehyde dehydrogenase n=1 Tax=Rhodococcus koreensis TaxID=99653 RepID=UPI0036731241
MVIQTVNPATGELVRKFEALSSQQVDEHIQRSADAFRVYRRSSYAERAALLHAAADILDSECDDLAKIATLEMGKTFEAAKVEVRKCASGCRWYADHGAEMLADEPWPAEGPSVYTRYEPLGPILAVMPWNFPFWQVIRFAAPALMAGNTVLLKHASNVPQVALAIEDVLRRAGFAEGVFSTLLISAAAVEGIIADRRVRGVTLTGSEEAGRSVGAAAGRHIKPSVLELGGADPFIVMPSADLERAISAAITSRTMNNGQSCVNAKRFIVHADVVEDFVRRFSERMGALRVGDPMDSETDIGPLATGDAVQTLHRQVTGTIDAGAQVHTGGALLEREGYFYPPTVLTNIPNGSPGHLEEFFGPVALVWEAADVDDAIRIANDSPLGLGGSAWTSDPVEKQRFVDEVETGMMYINDFTASIPSVPFGGTKDSGYGRELARFGAQTFTNPKTVWLAQ